MVMRNLLGVFVVLVIGSGFRFGAEALNMNYYIMTCPFAEAIVRNTVNRALQADPTLAASLIRMHFHDCFIQVSLSPSINNAKEQLEEQCPGVVSCADIVAMAARDAVFWAGGPVYDIPKGRKDGMRSRIEDTINLPFPTFNASELIRSFGFSNPTFHVPSSLLSPSSSSSSSSSYSYSYSYHYLVYLTVK
ncbi:peroxidase 47-like [Carica papaya]|uniref:peroxidase 47-like n=1 Tax=Carica papaya TaxID=3649 RepID=UPI000B8CC1CA|nr:peroxidase 47-like [Carica papaya]